MDRDMTLAARRVVITICCFALFGSAACTIDERRGGVPAEAQALIDRVTEAVAAGRFESVYEEAAEEWRRAATPEQSRDALGQVRDRLGKVVSRTLHAGREREGTSSGDDSTGHTLTISYQTTFERGIGTETFALVKRDGRWLLARYFVSSDGLKQ
ncbi:MAG: DUF4019 domain-containing protein [Acidobacteriota bacterium]|nr:DUF4019 domain-containing protein [Acidobacteriota bacterium]